MVYVRGGGVSVRENPFSILHHCPHTVHDAQNKYAGYGATYGDPYTQSVYNTVYASQLLLLLLLLFFLCACMGVIHPVYVCAIWTCSRRCFNILLWFLSVAESMTMNFHIYKCRAQRPLALSPSFSHSLFGSFSLAANHHSILKHFFSFSLSLSLSHSLLGKLI